MHQTLKLNSENQKMNKQSFIGLAKSANITETFGVTLCNMEKWILYKMAKLSSKKGKIVCVLSKKNGLAGFTDNSIDNPKVMVDPWGIPDLEPLVCGIGRSVPENQ